MSCLWFLCHRGLNSDTDERVEEPMSGEAKRRRKRGRWRFQGRKEKKLEGNFKEGEVEKETDQQARKVQEEVNVLDGPIELTPDVLEYVSAETQENTSPPAQDNISTEFDASIKDLMDMMLEEITANTEQLLTENQTTMMADEAEVTNVMDLMTTSLVSTEEASMEEPLDINMVTTEAEAVRDAAASTSPPLAEVQQLNVDSSETVRMLLEDTAAVSDQRLAENETLIHEEPVDDTIRDLMVTLDDAGTSSSPPLESEPGEQLQTPVTGPESGSNRHLGDTEQLFVDEIPTSQLLDRAADELLELLELERAQREAAVRPVSTKEPLIVVISERLELLLKEVVRRSDHLLVNHILGTMASYPGHKVLVDLLKPMLNDFAAQLTSLERTDKTSNHPLRDELPAVEHAEKQTAPAEEELILEELLADTETLQNEDVISLTSAEAQNEELSGLSTDMTDASNNHPVAEVEDLQVAGAATASKRKTRRGTRGKGRKIKYIKDNERGEAPRPVHQPCEPNRTQRRDEQRGRQQWTGEQIQFNIPQPRVQNQFRGTRNRPAGFNQPQREGQRGTRDRHVVYHPR